MSGAWFDVYKNVHGTFLSYAWKRKRSLSTGNFALIDRLLSSFLYSFHEIQFYSQADFCIFLFSPQAAEISNLLLYFSLLLIRNINRNFHRNHRSTAFFTFHHNAILFSICQMHSVFHVTKSVPFFGTFQRPS